MSKTLELFPDQAEIIAELREAMKKYKAILLQSPTGSGKTAMALYMILKAVEKRDQLDKLKDKRIIFSVPRKDLLEQTSETFSSFNIQHSYLASGKKQVPTSPVYIGMAQTMSRRIKTNEDGSIIEANLPQGYIVIIDEAQFGAAELGLLIKFYKSQGAWIIGLSATPWKANGQGLGMWFDYMVKGKSISWLIENKRLSDYDYYYGRTRPDLSKIKTGDGEYNQTQLGSFMEEQGVIIGDCLSDYMTRCRGKVHIIRAASIKHSQMIAETFRNAGIIAVHVDGDTPMDERKRIFRAYALREIEVLCFCDLLTFGFDLSQASGGLDVCIESSSDLKPQLSLSSQMQFWGRTLRYKPYPAIFNDHVNNHIEHGFPCSDREWTLESRKRKQGGGKEPVPPSRQCGKCYYAHPPKPCCPKCGYEYPIESRQIDEVDGELVKADKEEMKRLKKIETSKRLEEQSKAKSMDELIKLAQSKGYKNPVGWASHIYRSRLEKAERKKANV